MDCNGFNAFQLGCPEKKQRPQPTRRCSESALTSQMTPLERIVKTKPIWYLPDVTREESVKLLANKKTGVRSWLCFNEAWAELWSCYKYQCTAAQPNVLCNLYSNHKLNKQWCKTLGKGMLVHSVVQSKSDILLWLQESLPTPTI